MLKKALNEFQTNWVLEYRKSTIMTRGKSKAVVSQIPVVSRTFGTIMPERARLAQTMTHLGSVSHSAKLSILKDLVTFITRDHSVIYLPNEEPVHDRCPVASCHQDISKHVPKPSPTCSFRLKSCQIQENPTKLAYTQLPQDWIHEEPVVHAELSTLLLFRLFLLIRWRRRVGITLSATSGWTSDYVLRDCQVLQYLDPSSLLSTMSR